MFLGNSPGEACPECKRLTKVEDWACPRCGLILAPYLFSTITSKSVSGKDEDAFWAGYGACMNQWIKTQSVELIEYRPVAGRETAFRAGWRHATDELEAKDERRRGRKRGLVLLGSGVVSTFVGGMALYFSDKIHVHLPHQVEVLLGLGIINTVLGLHCLITGDSDQ
jgi:hypothetical protein